MKSVLNEGLSLEKGLYNILKNMNKVNKYKIELYSSF